MENEQHMNPNFPKQRGCFLDKRTEGKVILVDYPTWSINNGRYVFGNMNKPIDRAQSEKTFASVVEAYEFAASENYVVCADPWTKPKFEKKARIEDDDIED